jgi:hyperosmotically inducible periplasmic protein
MNAVRVVRLAGLISTTTFLLACLNAQAQPQPAGSEPTPQVASGPSQNAGENRAANRQLVKDVRRALRKASPRGLRPSNITVRANNGVVSLTGSVPAADQIDLAINVVKEVPGVQSVNSRLVVRKDFSTRGSN